MHLLKKKIYLDINNNIWLSFISSIPFFFQGLRKNSDINYLYRMWHFGNHIGYIKKSWYKFINNNRSLYLEVDNPILCDCKILTEKKDYLYG